MKHVYSGTELRSRGTMPAGGPPPAPPPRPDPDPSGPTARGVLLVAIAILLVLLVGLALLGAWAWSSRSDAPAPLPDSEPAAGAALDFTAANRTPGAALEEYLRTSPLQARQLFEYVKNSEHVQGNRVYREALERVHFLYEADDDTVNAYATARDNGAGDRNAVQEIRCYAGAGRFAKLISLGLAAELDGRQGAVQSLLGAMTPDQFASLGAGEAEKLARDAGLDGALAKPAVRTKADSIASGMLLTVLAHESGHQALGHVFGNAVNLEISRNQEREADTFASSVISSSGFGEYMFDGMLFWQCALVSQQDGETGEGTHPLAKERLANLIRQNPEKAAAWGIAQNP